MKSEQIIDSLRMQLRDVYADRQRLHRRFGVSDSAGIAQLIGSLEDQLRVLYADAGQASSDLGPKEGP